MTGAGNGHSEDFLERRTEAHERLDQLTGAKGGTSEDRKAWFRAVYRDAGNDPAAVPWADLAPKQVLVDWLADNPGEGRKTAIDIACGLGDNAEALAAAGYETSAFDLAPEAIEWAKERFPDTSVDYRAADLFDLPQEWQGKFDLVHECYTVQALKDPLRSNTLGVLAGLLVPGGRLLLIARSRNEGAEVDGPPWPLMPSEWKRFEEFGLSIVFEDFYTVERPGRSIPHVMALFEKR